MKKFIAILLCVVCVALPALSLSGCATPPAVEEIYDRVVELIEASYEINTVFYGPGLPVYDTNSDYAEINHLYYGFVNKGKYEYVTEYAKFQNEQQIMELAQKVYARGFLNDVLSVAAFTGYANSDGAGNAQFFRARYLEEKGVFYQSTGKHALYTGMRIYDYTSMQVLSLGRSDACKVVMDSWLEDTPENVERVEISLLLQDGKWFLDSFVGG